MNRYLCQSKELALPTALQKLRRYFQLMMQWIVLLPRQPWTMMMLTKRSSLTLNVSFYCLYNLLKQFVPFLYDVCVEHKVDSPRNSRMMLKITQLTTSISHFNYRCSINLFNMSGLSYLWLRGVEQQHVFHLPI